MQWTTSYSTTKAEAELVIEADSYDEVIAKLHELGYTEYWGFEIERFTDQINVYKRTNYGRRTRLILMP